MNQEYIRNFCIIAHIDHGKSTLADRMLELTGTVEKRDMQAQILDRNPIERERGITIKLQPVRMEFDCHCERSEAISKHNGIATHPADVRNDIFILNLIDTPGHVDFSYEVSRSLESVEGAILLVDASQGIQAQTLSNLKIAQKLGLKIIPVINKIDLPHAQPEKIALEVIKLLGCAQEEIIFASGKTGEGVEEILERIVKDISPPRGEENKPLRALIFDSVYDKHRGVVVFVRVVDGSIKTKDEVELLGSLAKDEAMEVGYFTPDPKAQAELITGEIGYIVTGLKDIRQVRVGDTLTNSKFKIQNSKLRGGDDEKNILPIAKYSPPKPMVYASIFPVSPADYPLLKDSIGKYALTDASLNIEPENSPVLGFGYRLGFLGLLHVEIVSERLKREYDQDIIITTPQVEYQVILTDNSQISVHSAIHLPDISRLKEIKEPWVKLEILSPSIYLGRLIELCKDHRAIDINPVYQTDETVLVKSAIPLSEIIVNFYDELKSASSGYASMNYESVEYISGKLVKLDIILSGEKVSALSQIIPAEQAEKIAKEKVAKLKEIIPKQMFEVRIQAAIGGQVIASERISAMRKDVTAKLYGGDVTRKRKLLEKQKKGKSRMRKFGKVELPSDVFVKLLRK